MRTLKILIAGVVLLGLCLVVARWIGQANAATTARGTVTFLLLWLGIALANFAYGVLRAGYSVKEELPILALVFFVPALIAVVVWWELSP